MQTDTRDRSAALHLRVPEVVRSALDERARAEMTTVSAVVRRAIAHELERPAS